MATNNLLHPLIQQAPDKAYPKACFLPGGMHISEECISLLQGQLEWREHWRFNYWHVIVPIPSLEFKVSCILFLELTFYNCFVLGLLILWTGILSPTPCECLDPLAGLCWRSSNNTPTPQRPMTFLGPLRPLASS